MKELTVSHVHELAVKSLGLDPDATDLTSLEAISEMLRRAAGLLCPCDRSSLLEAVLTSLRGIADDAHDTVTRCLEALIASGDLIEMLRSDDDPDSRYSQIYAAPPSFIKRMNGAVILLGVGTDGLYPLPEELLCRVEKYNHLRRLPCDMEHNLPARLSAMGFVDIPEIAWLARPLQESPERYLVRMDELLDTSPPAGDDLELQIIDPEANVRFYRGRWAMPNIRTGRFVAKRSVRYGSGIWSYVELKQGVVRRLTDLPSPGEHWRGCDVAWRLQAAIDAVRGVPQQMRIRSSSTTADVFDLFSPIPAWASRRWDTLGNPAVPSGCLMSYSIPQREVKEELDFAREMLWLDVVQ